jgi:hypothetical protein
MPYLSWFFFLVVIFHIFVDNPRNLYASKDEDGAIPVDMSVRVLINNKHGLIHKGLYTDLTPIL